MVEYGSMADEAGREKTPLVLVVEDNAVVALDLETALADAGIEVLGPAYTVAQALGLLIERRPDFAVLDFNLAGEHVTAVAVRLRELGVPFVLTSAYSSVGLRLGPAFDGVINLGKPINMALLVQRVRATLGA